MILASQLELKPSYFNDNSEPDQNSAVGVESKDQCIQSGIWESGPGVLDLHFRWSETVYILEGQAEVKNLATNEIFRLVPGTIAIFEKGSTWSWRIPWKIKKVFTVIDYN